LICSVLQISLPKPKAGKARAERALAHGMPSPSACLPACLCWIAALKLDFWGAASWLVVIGGAEEVTIVGTP